MAEPNDDWRKYGNRAWVIAYITDEIQFDNVHKDLKLIGSIPNLITDKKEIKELKETMHFALVI